MGLLNLIPIHKWPESYWLSFCIIKSGYLGLHIMNHIVIMGFFLPLLLPSFCRKKLIIIFNYKEKSWLSFWWKLEMSECIFKTSVSGDHMNTKQLLHSDREDTRPRYPRLPHPFYNKMLTFTLHHLVSKASWDYC